MPDMTRRAVSVALPRNLLDTPYGPSAEAIRMKIAYRWIAAVIAIIFVVDLQLHLLARESLDQLGIQAAATLKVSSNVVLRRAEQLFDTYDRTLSGLSEVVGIRAGLTKLEIHRLLVRRHAITPDVHWLLVTRADGQLAATSLSFPAPDLNISHREYYTAQTDSWDAGLYIGPPLVDMRRARRFVPTSRRITNDGGLFLGVAVAAVDQAGLANILSAQALPEGYVLRLFLRGGAALACLPDSEDCYTRDWSKTPLFSGLLDRAAEGDFRGGALFGDESALGAYASSAKYPLVVTATVSESQVLAPWRQIARRYVAIGISSNLALILIAVFAYRQFQRRRKAVDALAEANIHLEERVAARTNELRLSEARARLFMNTATDAVVVCDQEKKIVEFNMAAEQMFGYSAGEALGRSLGFLLPEPEAIEDLPVNRATVADESPILQTRELKAQSKDGREFFIEATVGCTENAGPALFVCVIRDISDRKATEEEMRRLATTDALTGVLNRGAWTRRTEELIANARRYGRPLTLMSLDADKFKHINDTYGHPTGDLVLKALAKVLNVRAGDIVGRLGGEEFGITLPETDAEGAQEFARRLLGQIRQCRVSDGEHTLSFTVSIGLTSFDCAGDDSLEAALKRADRALYVAKERGRDQFVRLDGDCV
ncbi:diguanylate cyclase [Aromatoleum petrolei]|uniref:Diguanylate cyclase n=2 Tax=Aromatoleum petrolei TaxID=76116 RepID=A0ABX1MPQ7_9RHOO|nr:diguanylate cyclase [Aromatoleum petrolei]